MLGAIIGDLAGSIYEFNQTKFVKKIKIKNIIENNSFFSDDTILTIAIADAILNNCKYEEKLKEYALNYENLTSNLKPYFEKMFSPSFLKWAKGNFEGYSSGNGAMMRISPVGYLFNSEKEVLNNAYLAIIPSHNSEEAIKCAQIVASIIFYARQGLTKKEIVTKLNLKIKKPVVKKFNYTCATTIDLCLFSLFKAKSFEDSIKKAISFGGDTDTNACIVGSMAEAMYGIDEKLKEQALQKLPVEFVDILNRCYSEIDKNIDEVKN